MTKLETIANKAVKRAIAEGIIQADDRQAIRAVAQLAAATAVLAAPEVYAAEILEPLYLDLPPAL